MLLIKIINFILFQIGWVTALYFNTWWSGLICLLFAITNFRLLFLHSVPNLLIGCLIASLGMLNDALLLWHDVISIRSISSFPFWLAGLWLLFTSTFDGCLSWLNNKSLVLLSFVGAIGGATSYYAGCKIGAINYHFWHLPDFVFFALNWALLFPALFRLNSLLKAEFNSRT